MVAIFYALGFILFVFIFVVIFSIISWIYDEIRTNEKINSYWDKWRKNNH